MFLSHPQLVPRNSDLMREFQDTLNYYGLSDLDFEGVPFTWSNQRFGASLVQERFDRFLCTEQWRDTLISARVSHITVGGLDHLPICIKLY